MSCRVAERLHDVELAQGTLRGVPHAQHTSFLGVPYARPPVGPLRFAPPLAPEPWSGVRDGSSFAASCPQPKDHAVLGFAASGPRDEDCLYLNVYTPRVDGQRRPVLLWVHGGGFTHGSGSELLYDGAALAQRGDVVVVSIHYRLGPLGFLYLGAHGGGEWGAGDNLGLRDQVAAMRWVRDNIAAFGGDPDNVTLFGESAGAMGVTAVMAMPSAKGLLHRVIAQSGTANRLGNPQSATRGTARFLKHLGLEHADPERLRALPVDALVDAQIQTGIQCGPIWGVESLPGRPLDHVRAGHAADLSLLVGTNRDESKLFKPPRRTPIDDEVLHARVQAHLPRNAAGRCGEVIDIYRRSRAGRGLPTDNLNILDAVESDAHFRTAARRLAAAQHAHQPQSFLYLFTRESPARGGSLGACHALEIPFVFGATDQPLQRRFAGAGPEATVLSHAMMDAWIAFARTGDPSHPAIGPWPAYDAERQATMVFDDTSATVDAPFPEEAAIWDALLSR